VLGVEGRPLPRYALAEPVELEEMQWDEEVIAEYDVLGFSPTAQIVELYRPQLQAAGYLSATEMQYATSQTEVTVAGLVVCRQRPSTAKGVVFISLLDETGLINVVVRPQIYQQYRPAVRASGLMVVHGIVEHGEGVTNVVANRVEALPRAFRAPAAKNFR